MIDIEAQIKAAEAWRRHEAFVRTYLVEASERWERHGRIKSEDTGIELNVSCRKLFTFVRDLCATPRPDILWRRGAPQNPELDSQWLILVEVPNGLAPDVVQYYSDHYNSACGIYGPAEIVAHVPVIQEGGDDAE